MSALAPCAWTPLVAGAEAEEALAAVQAIASDLSRADLEGVQGPALAGGMAGIALFWAYLERALGGTLAEPPAELWLDRAIAGLASLPSAEASLYHGFTGVAWVVEHLDGGQCPSEDDDPNSDVDQALVALLSRQPWRGDFDLLQGLVGWGVYALERLPRPSATAIFALVLARLAECAGRRAWVVLGRGPRHGAAGPDLGMAHGIGGVIALLARAVILGAAGPDAVPILSAAVDGVLGSEVLERESADGDLAWCAGTCGLSVALLGAGRACSRPAWQQQALHLAQVAAGRYLDVVHGFDPALCHGTAGLSHLFHRMHLATGDPGQLNAARHWLRRTLAQRRPGSGIGGFLCRARGADGTFGWASQPGFLGGAAGIGLALLAASSPIRPEWDRLLLLAP